MHIFTDAQLITHAHRHRHTHIQTHSSSLQSHNIIHTSSCVQSVKATLKPNTIQTNYDQFSGKLKKRKKIRISYLLKGVISMEITYPPNFSAFHLCHLIFLDFQLSKLKSTCKKWTKDFSLWINTMHSVQALFLFTLNIISHLSSILYLITRGFWAAWVGCRCLDTAGPVYFGLTLF